MDDIIEIYAAQNKDLCERLNSLEDCIEYDPLKEYAAEWINPYLSRYKKLKTAEAKALFIARLAYMAGAFEGARETRRMIVSKLIDAPFTTDKLNALDSSLSYRPRASSIGDFFSDAENYEFYQTSDSLFLHALDGEPDTDGDVEYFGE